MSEEIRETWLQKIRDIAPLIEKAEYESLKSDADVKRVLAVLKTKAPVIDVAQWNRESKNPNPNTGKKTVYMWTSCEAIAGDPVEGSQVDNTTEVDDEPMPF